MMDRTKHPYVGMVNDLDGDGWKIRNPEWVQKWDKDAVVPPTEVLSQFNVEYSYGQKLKIRDGKNVVEVWALYAWLDYYSSDDIKMTGTKNTEYKIVYYGKKRTGHNVGFTKKDIVAS